MQGWTLRILMEFIRICKGGPLEFGWIQSAEQSEQHPDSQASQAGSQARAYSLAFLHFLILIKWKIKKWQKIIENELKLNENEKRTKLEKWSKWENWNEAVWDVIWTARKQEKMFWTAEIELYRNVMSNGWYGYSKIEKRSVCFWISRPLCQRVIVDGWFFVVLASAEALKN